MEIWDNYDIDRVFKGTTMKRGAEFKQGDYHLIVHICLFDAKGNMLIQQRQPFKEGWSNMWDLTVGGSSISGENSRQAAKRELFEEIGLEYDFSNVRPNITINYEHGFDDYYLIEKEVNELDLCLQYEEVQRVKWANECEILRMIQSGVFIPYYASFITFLFASSKGVGALNRHSKQSLSR